MHKKKGLVLLSGLGITAGAAALGYFIKKGKLKDNHSMGEQLEEEIFFNYPEISAIDYTDAKKKALDKAIEKLGNGAKVASAIDHKVLTVKISGESRHCFMFGAVADDLSINPETLLIYVDSSTGEVFESTEIKD